MNRLHILGRKNHGKTTLLVELTAYFAAHGMRVGTIKHTHHAHELDTPGKDSHRHREAGAAVSAILSRSMNAVFWPPRPDEQGGGDRYAAFAPHFADCDLVLVEGDTVCEGVKIEVWRAAVGSEPMALADAKIRAVITDDDVDVPVSIVPRQEIAAIAARVLELAGPEAPKGRT